MESLSKCYRIGLKDEVHDTFGGMLISWLRSPIDNYRRLRRLGNFDDMTGSTASGGSSGSRGWQGAAVPDDRRPEASTLAAPPGPSQSEDIIWALRDVSFEVRPGEVLGIIGRNSAGKSTLLKILSRITEPTSGRVEIHGRVASLLEVGTGFHPELTGRENIYLNGTILGMTKKEVEARFDEIVDFSGVERFVDTPVKRYSSGMRVRLAFAVAAHLNPEILLIDEVLAVGDIQFQKKCLGKMRNVASDGRTVLFVSHNLFAVRELCSRCLLLGNGTVAATGATDDVVDFYVAYSTRHTEGGEVLLDETWSGQRTSPGTARVAALRTLNAQGAVTDRFGIHDPITFEAELTLARETENVSVKGFCVSFSVKNRAGVWVYHVRSQDSSIATAGANGRVLVRCTIPDLRLTEGRYTVAVWLGNHLNQLEDFAEDVLAFFVVNRNHSVGALNAVIHETGTWSLETGL